ncbi:MAG: class I SAM-dependent methyltransferase, partial [Bacteroidales bacterium]|nr:class I SAM-dependent methyltransferase [Bacteroidales bacterium]
TRKIDKNDVSNVLEIGCAYGFFGELIKKHFPGIQYTGIDISNDAIDYGKKKLGLNLHSVDYLNFKTNKEFSDIYLWDVIEHLPEPDKVIAKASSELQKNGRLILTTGDIDSYLARFKKRKWRLIHPPTHLHYFSKKTITKLLAKNNFQVISIHYPSILRSLKQSWYSLFLLDEKQNTISKKIFQILPDLNIRINTFDIMMVIAIKK